jgi:hypothetical protein
MRSVRLRRRCASNRICSFGRMGWSGVVSSTRPIDSEFNCT